jgi:hypothetical protein
MWITSVRPRHPRAGHEFTQGTFSLSMAIQQTGLTRFFCRADLSMRNGRQETQSRLSSQRLQELDDRYLVLSLQFVELLGYMSRFAAMPHDGVPECEGCAVVHHSRTEADSP